MTKDQEELFYIISNHDHSSITSLIKLTYLIELHSLQKNNNRINSYVYKRYNFGPFDKAIYDDINQLEENGLIESVSQFSNCDEYTVYKKTDDDDIGINFTELTQEEIKTIQEVLDVFRGYGAKALTDAAYKTKPMQSIGATLGGREGFNQELDLQAR